MEHEISAIYGVTHGAGLSVMVPAWMTFVMKRDVTKIAQFARRVFGVEGNNDMEVATEGINRLKAFWRSLGMPVTMKELGIDNPDIDALVDKLRGNKGDKIGGYVSLTMDDCKEIYAISK
jgi:alcohol dehydrogenase YqhD (iron-dependent ADH family)